ncbi:hypothetical protein JMJ35_000149 [Cladonia borealis]|uniref:Laccase n=1 Tax=Cladonia borealis TaxID=184061 RepID=A0AA39RAP5_9LECA|nr:hypothetical protein JMJ35_000149 [Cladonia borealis]
MPYIRWLFAVCYLTTTQALAQNQLDDTSQLGLLNAPTYSPFLTNNPLPNGYPWGNRTANDSNPYTDVPDTNVIRYYNFTISRGQAAPDGYVTNVIVVNDQFPGPLIEANWGDWIEVSMTNNISGPEEGTALHWHGLMQSTTPWFDGVPSVGQCPVAPGASFTYRFRADQYGTSWYHSHYSSQYAGGILGPMIIHGPSNYDYDIDLGPVFLQDWFHKDYFTIVEQLESVTPTPNEPNNFNISNWRQYADSNLINGKGNYSCALANNSQGCTNNAPLAQFRFQQGKKHRLRLINSGAAATQLFSIDGHNLTVIANDYVQLVPYTTQHVFLAAGQRTDVIVEATGNINSSYWMRSNISVICALAVEPSNQALAEVFYDNANITKQPKTQPWYYNDTGACSNDPLNETVPYYAIASTTKPSTTITLLIDRIINSTGNMEWRMNQQTFRANYNDPLLLLAQEQNTTYPPESNVYHTGSNQTVRLIVNNNSTSQHPMHLHGHVMSVLHQGPGYWDNVSLTNMQNPQRRDVQMLPPSGHIVLQYEAKNPGVWPFHCHIAWHLSQGLYVNLMEQADNITSMQIPSVIPEMCKNWNFYTSQDVVEQIDSGL